MTDLAHAFGRPISPELPGGEDLAFAPEWDEIRSARAGDDPSLAQGDWVRELRSPQWPRVAELCERILTTRSKDLQVAGWYAEALTRLQGLPGLAVGLRTVELLLGRFWHCCHPTLEDDGAAEERAGKLEWLNVHLTAAVNLAPGPAGTVPSVREAEAACQALETTIAEKFGQDPPSLADLAAAIQVQRERLERALGPCAPAPPVGPDPEPAQTPALTATPDAPGTPCPSLPGPDRRTAAVRELRAIAAYFRATEPHSPVPHLLERAAGWADMPLEQWLAAVIKDPGTLGQLKELLDLAPPAAGSRPASPWGAP
jgi:type VI secretion system protein ImpA